jgi:hypothetical protein
MTAINPADAAAFQRAADERSEIQRLMASPEYRAGDLSAHAKVRLYYLRAYGSGGDPVRTAMGPGQVPMSPFAR